MFTVGIFRRKEGCDSLIRVGILQRYVRSILKSLFCQRPDLRRVNRMDESKGRKDSWRYANSASLKFETDGDKLLEVSIFADRTTAKKTLWFAWYKYERAQWYNLMDGLDDLEIEDEWLVQKMIEIIKECEKHNTFTYYYQKKPCLCKEIKIIRELESERTIHYGFNKDLKWDEFPERLKMLFV